MRQPVVAIAGEITEAAAGKFAMERRRPPQGLYSVADLARKEGLDPKSARGRLRKHFGGTLAELGISDWTYGPEDVDFVLNIIRPAGGRSVEARERYRAEARAPMERAAEPRLKAFDPYSWPRKPRAELALPSASGVYALFLRENSTVPDLVPLAEGRDPCTSFSRPRSRSGPRHREVPVIATSDPRPAIPAHQAPRP